MSSSSSSSNPAAGDRPGGKRPSVRDVAAAAGVSIGTVSRYLNGRPLTPRTRELVEKGMEETSYHERAESAEPKRQKSLVAGALFPNFDVFHASVLSALEKRLFGRGYHMITSGYEDDETVMREKLTVLRNRNLDGIICSPVTSNYRVIRDILELGIPVVTYNNYVKSWRTDHVMVDDRAGATRAVEYLIHMNHERIGIIAGDYEASTGYDRLHGYYDALREAGIAERPEYVRGGAWDDRETTLWARELLSLPEPPTAILASNYQLAYGLLRGCREAGVRVPEDLSVISFDDTDVFQFHSPPITAIRQPVDQIAGEVATLLFRRIAGDWSTYPALRTLHCEMILRASVRKLP